MIAFIGNNNIQVHLAMACTTINFQIYEIYSYFTCNFQVDGKIEFNFIVFVASTNIDEKWMFCIRGSNFSTAIQLNFCCRCCYYWMNQLNYTFSQYNIDADSRHADGMKEIVYYIARCHYAPRKNYFANVDASILKMTCNERKDGARSKEKMDTFFFITNSMRVNKFFFLCLLYEL